MDYAAVEVPKVEGDAGGTGEDQCADEDEGPPEDCVRLMLPNGGTIDVPKSDRTTHSLTDKLSVAAMALYEIELSEGIRSNCRIDSPEEFYSPMEEPPAETPEPVLPLAREPTRLNFGEGSSSSSIAVQGRLHVVTSTWSFSQLHPVMGTPAVERYVMGPRAPPR